MSEPDADISTVELARQIRRETLQMVTRARASHVGGALSCTDVLAVLYGGALRVHPGEPDWPERDRFILSKGHCCSALYAALALRGFFPVAELASYCNDGSRLGAHASHFVPGVEFSTGSLGHGLPFGCGKALAARQRKRGWRTVVLLSDGELDEGSNWEAALFAGHHRLDALTAIIDYNQIQSLGAVREVLNLEPLADKFRAFGWAVKEIEGHDHQALRETLRPSPWTPGQPSCLIAHTIKGKGVDYMENNLAWHYKSPTPEQLQDALRQLEPAT